MGDGDYQISYAAWMKSKLLALVKDFPDPKINSLEFEWHFHLIISAYQPGFSDLYQYSHAYRKYLGQEWMWATDWNKPLEDFKLTDAQGFEKSSEQAAKLLRVIPQSPLESHMPLYTEKG